MACRYTIISDFFIPRSCHDLLQFHDRSLAIEKKSAYFVAKPLSFCLSGSCNTEKRMVYMVQDSFCFLPSFPCYPDNVPRGNQCCIHAFDTVTCSQEFCAVGLHLESSVFGCFLTEI